MLKFFVKEDPKELVRKWQTTLRAEQRVLDRQVREIQTEEKKVHKAIREAAKRGDMGCAKHLAKEVVQSRKVVNQLYVNKAHLQGLNTALMEQMAMMRVAGTLSKSTEVMKAVNSIMKAPELQKTMMEMSKEMMKVGLIEEMMSEAIDSAVGGEVEEETEEEVMRVLNELAKETSAALPAARQRVRERQAAAQAKEDADMEELRTRLDAVKA